MLVNCSNGDPIYPSRNPDYFTTYQPARENPKALLPTEKQAAAHPGYLEGQPYTSTIEDPLEK